MSRFVDSVATVNSLIRTLLALAVLGGLSAAAWVGYSSFLEKDRQQLALAESEQKLAETEAALQQVHQDLESRTAELQRRMEEIKELELDVEAKAQQIEQLDTAMRLLKVNHRLARLMVLDQ
jgi:septal ring factor EnvC (AmiA/AmiB activator)